MCPRLDSGLVCNQDNEAEVKISDLRTSQKRPFSLSLLRCSFLGHVENPSTLTLSCWRDYM